MKMNRNEMEALYAFGCPNLKATVERLRMVAALAPDPVAKKLFYIRIYGDYPDEKAHAQVRASAEPEQQEPEHFIDHFYVAEDIQKRGALDIKE